MFCIQISKPFYKLMLPILVSMASHTQSTPITSLKNLCSKSRKKQDMKLIFVEINIKVLNKVVLSYLMEAAKQV